MNKKTVSAIICLAALIFGWYQKGELPSSQKSESTKQSENTTNTNTGTNVSSPLTNKLASMTYRGKMVVKVNNDVPSFKASDMTKKTYIKLSKLDSLGRCGSNMMCAYYTSVPTDERGDISSVKPSGWRQSFITKNRSSFALYNRSHLLMRKLSGLDANPQNLITGTEQFNKKRGMLSVESQILDYVMQTRHHVIYRVTPVYKGNDLVARGVLMEAKSVEDNNLSLCRYVFNVEDGVKIDYATGAASASSSSVSVRGIN